TVEDSLRQGYGDPGDPHLLALATRGFGPQEIVEALTALLNDGLPAAFLDEDPLSPEAVRAFRLRLAGACRAVHELIARRPVPARLKNLKKIEQALGVLIARLEEPAAISPAVLAGWRAELLPDNLVNHLKGWAGGLEKTEAELLGDAAPELAAAARVLAGLLAHVAELDPVLLDHGRQALRPLLARVENELRSRGIATFDFLLAGAESLLARHPEVRRQVRRRIDQLLVDEFQ